MACAYSKGMIKKHSFLHLPSGCFPYIHFRVVLQEEDGCFPLDGPEKVLLVSRQRHGVADDHNLGGSIWN